MKTVVVENESRRKDELLEQAVQRIVERAQKILPQHIKMVAEAHDVESANSDDRFYVMYWIKILGLPIKEAILLTAPRYYSQDNYTLFINDPAIFEIAQEEIGRFCESLDINNLTINKTY